MIAGLIDTLTLVRDAMLGLLPMNSIEILKQIPHPVPQGWDAVSQSIIKAADWSIPDDQKILSRTLMDPGYDPVASDQLRTMINNDPLIADLKNRFTSLRMAAVAFPPGGAPVIGTIRPDENAPGASTAKIAGLYALYQLLYEMSKLAVDNSLGTIPALQRKANEVWAATGFTNNRQLTRLPQLNLLFQFYDEQTVEVYRGAPPKPVSDLFGLFDSTPRLFFKKDILKLLWRDESAPRTDDVVGFSHGNSPGLLFRYLGFAYVASVMVQSGLFDPSTGPFGAGIWVRNDFNKRSWSNDENPIPVQQIKDGTVTRPGLPSIQNITAKSVADFLVLLSQGRLVNHAASDEILLILGEGGCIRNVDDATLIADKLGVIAAKCGYDRDINNDALLLQDRETAARYVIVLLGNQPGFHKEFVSTERGRAGKAFAFYKQVRAALKSFS